MVGCGWLWLLVFLVLWYRFAVMVVKIQKTDGCNENGQAPAKCHRKKLNDKHKQSVYDEHVFAHDEADDAFIYKSGVGI